MFQYQPVTWAHSYLGGSAKKKKRTSRDLVHCNIQGCDNNERGYLVKSAVGSINKRLARPL